MGPRVALLGMILESNRFARPAGRADFERLTWLGGDALLTEARAEIPSLALEFAAFVRAMDATGPWTPLPVLLAASHPAGPVEPMAVGSVLWPYNWPEAIDGAGQNFPIIGVGGIHNPEEAEAKILAGANLVQIYTGLIYQGPGLVKQITEHTIDNQTSAI